MRRRVAIENGLRSSRAFIIRYIECQATDSMLMTGLRSRCSRRRCSLWFPLASVLTGATLRPGSDIPGSSGNDEGKTSSELQVKRSFGSAQGQWAGASVSSGAPLGSMVTSITTTGVVPVLSPT
ncbi:hypothetical protein GCM10023094_43180 [Rhodococcus olei]|uniref:Uncharacterized protein n=1 Tax=Rhodococcus olei TaxID=2161675 RepID=A0ABP8PI10_9NOCA